MGLGVVTIVLFIVFGDALYILCSSGWAIFGLVAYMIFAIIITVEKAKDLSDGANNFWTTFMLILTVFSSIMLVNLSTFDISESVIISYENIEGISVGNNSKLYFNIENKTDKNLGYIKVEVTFFDGDVELCSNRWYWEGKLESGENITLNAEIKTSLVDLSEVNDLGMTVYITELNLYYDYPQEKDNFKFDEYFYILYSNEYLETLEK